MSGSNFTLQNSESVFNQYFKIKKNTYLTPNGKEKTYHVLDSKDAVLVFALTTDKQVVLVKQFRAGQNDYTTELPAGKVDENEELIDAAKREMLEETGYDGDLEFIGSIWKGPSNTGKFHVFFCDNARKVQEQELTEFEEGLEVVLIPLDKFLEQINDKKEVQVTGAIYNGAV
jgi:ADP-ribose pyrophosphatase